MLTGSCITNSDEPVVEYNGCIGSAPYLGAQRSHHPLEFMTTSLKVASSASPEAARTNHHDFHE